MLNNTRAEALLRRGFHAFNRLMLLMWRLGLGRWAASWPRVAGRIMVITHTGRRSGLRRRTPLNYAVVDGALYCTAGFGGGSDWYRNVLADPNVEIWLPRSRWDGAAEDVSTIEARLPLLREVLRGSGAVTYLVGIDPDRMDDAALAAATAAYKLVRIRLATPRSGPGGPGDLAWVWLVLVGLIMLQRAAGVWRGQTPAATDVTPAPARAARPGSSSGGTRGACRAPRRGRSRRAWR